MVEVSRVLLPAIALIAPPAIAQDVAAGSAVFTQRCQACHVVTPGARPGIGPNLAGVASRSAGSTGFAYSAALKTSKLKWGPTTLDQYLSAPAKFVPGTRMLVGVADAKQRAALVAYLVTLKD